jgi:hypothetical protein
MLMRMLPLLTSSIHLPRHRSRIFFRRILIAIAAASVVALAPSLSRVAEAQEESVVVYMPLHNQMERNDLVADAEFMAADAINAQFNQDSSLTSVQVSVLGDRNGEIIPILTTTVSRSEWQQDPRIAVWTRYHDSYALIQRHDEERLVAIAPASPSGSRRAVAQDLPPYIEAAYQEGRLPAELAQEYVNEFD